MASQWRLRGYVVERLLGSGASGDVWRARVAATGEAVALKRVAISDPAQARRAREEAALLTALDHPNLIRLHALVPDHDALVLVLDLADGGALSEVLAARGRLTPGEVITAIAPIAATLSYLHSSAVIHGDVSAANILFTEAGVPLLCDVGVARLTGDPREAEATPAYVDPAVAAGSVPGPPSDVFSLGAVAFHALTGTPVWDAGSAADTLALAARGVPDDLAQRLAAAAVPAPMSAAVLRALARDPHRRGSAVELALDLRQSATPLAVEFRAGRARTEPRLRDRTGLADAAGEGVPAGPREQVAGRPDFDRPGPRPEQAGTEPPTRMVVPRPRPAIPRAAGHRRPATFARRHRVPLLAGGTLVVGAAIVLALWRPGDAGPADAAPDTAAAGRASSTASGSGSASGAGSAGASSQSPQSSAGPSAAGARSKSIGSVAGKASATGSSAAARGLDVLSARTLADLDAVRSEAYATRTPTLLAHVYVPGPLLEHDRAQLRGLVPAGCGLTGALTDYRVLSARSAGKHSVVVVTAALPPTRLVCAGTARAAAAASGPTRLQIELTRTADGPRISAERRVG